ncbi:MAG: O-methyltransferase [Phycisphaerae bacterium]
MKEPKFYRLFDYNKKLLPNKFLAKLEKRTDSIEDAREQTGLSIGYPGWGIIYHLLLALLDPDRPNLIIETGTNLGSTAIIMAQALKDTGRRGMVHTIEIDQQTHEQAIARINKAGVGEYVTCHLGSSLDVLPELLDGSSKIRMALLDGDHSMEAFLKEFELIHPHLEKTSLVAMDNTYAIAEDDDPPRVFQGLQKIPEIYGGNLINLPYCSWYTAGMAFWQQEPFDRRAGAE